MSFQFRHIELSYQSQKKFCLHLHHGKVHFINLGPQTVAQFLTPSFSMLFTGFSTMKPKDFLRKVYFSKFILGHLNRTITAGCVK